MSNENDANHDRAYDGREADAYEDPFGEIEIPHSDMKSDLPRGKVVAVIRDILDKRQF